MSNVNKGCESCNYYNKLRINPNKHKKLQGWEQENGAANFREGNTGVNTAVLQAVLTAVHAQRLIQHERAILAVLKVV